MEIITEIADYETADLDLKINGEAVTIKVRSLLSNEGRDAKQQYLRLIESAEKNGIALTEKVEVGFGIEEEVETEHAKKLYAILISNLVVDWPFDEDIKQTIFDNPGLGLAIDVKATELQNSYLTEKKT